MMEAETPLDYAAPNLLSPVDALLRPEQPSLGRHSFSRLPQRPSSFNDSIDSSSRGTDRAGKVRQRPPRTLYSSHDRLTTKADAEEMKSSLQPAKIARQQGRRSVTECEMVPTSLIRQQYGSHCSPLPSRARYYEHNAHYTL